ncbi:class I SAM-dependent methyltransferase [Polynucleobacter sp. IMCC30063]|uniref:class I SAM-dependent methyltransferase n=1 Tax=Polynucleobacter sp. IMCC30063 TaxID=2907298 RepID=UPI001F1E6DCD|nr:class I SAM-dependent methyltransferase [Polynucleobacter sp. IMCC30063]MCE7505198.1 class I SAM-dependent methyltransferase [Polynucleobacter sp. IMCC30063]
MILNKRIITRLRGRTIERLLQSSNLPLPLPKNATEAKLFDFVTSIRVTDAPDEEMRNYSTHDFKRFIYTLGLAADETGQCLELGANPYFTTMLLKQFTNLKLSLANYFGSDTKDGRQEVSYRSFKDYAPLKESLNFKHFNIESENFPYEDALFDIVIFTEIIEHLTINPCRVLREIKRILKPEGVLILTTPNVARLENVARLCAGDNIYDPYSGYGTYGRHNREYNLQELITLLKYVGFDCEQSFTANVHHNAAEQFIDITKIFKILEFRKPDLGQYIFIKARNTERNSNKLPSWLFRSYAEELLE